MTNRRTNKWIKEIHANKEWTEPDFYKRFFNQILNNKNLNQIYHFVFGAKYAHDVHFQT